MGKIAVLDFGGQYCHLIARRIRELNVYSEIKEPTSSVEELEEYDGIILSGGPSSVYDKDAPKYNPDIFSLSKPILGICYGHQDMAHELNGKVSPGETKEYGIAELQVKDKTSLLKDMGDKEIVWMSHGDKIEELPKGFKVVGDTDDCDTAAMANEDKKYYGLQFHPEVIHTPNGMRILEVQLF